MVKRTARPGRRDVAARHMTSTRRPLLFSILLEVTEWKLQLCTGVATSRAAASARCDR
jgi:hypothetical protein